MRGAIVAFSPDSQMLAVGAVNVDLLREKDGLLIRRLDHRLNARLGQGIGSLAFSPDGQYLATADLEGNARCWRTSDGTVRWRAADPAEEVTFTPDSQLLVASSKEGVVRLQRLKDGREARTLRAGPRNYLTCSAVSPDGHVLVSSSKETKLWQVSNGLLIRSIKDARSTSYMGRATRRRSITASTLRRSRPKTQTSST